MKKCGAALLALMFLCLFAGCASSEQLPVNGFEAQCEIGKDYGWFVLQEGELVELLNEKGREAGYPELVQNETYEESYGFSADGKQYMDIQVLNSKWWPKLEPYLGNVCRVKVYTDIDDPDDAKAMGFYLDQIVGLFSPRDREQLEEDLMMFYPLEGYGSKEQTNGNVLYCRWSDYVGIDVNIEEAEQLVLEKPEPTPHLVKPE